MNRKIIVTKDNSKTLLIPDLNETYHSTHGAVNEALHVFIEAGLHHLKKTNVKLFEMGFGTGLNSLVSLDYALKNNIIIEYTSIEKFPLTYDLLEQLDYPNQIANGKLQIAFNQIHESEWNKIIKIDPKFYLKKIEGDLSKIILTENEYDLIYFDAFGPRVQKDLWSVEILKKMQTILKPSGILVTYCAQGQFRRNLIEAGFTYEVLPGPPGKREMTRAINMAE